MQGSELWLLAVGCWRLAREKANGNQCLGWPHGIESQRLPAQGTIGIGPDVVTYSKNRPGEDDVPVVSLSRCARPLDGCGVEEDGIEVRSRLLTMPLTVPGESFSRLGAIERESVGQLLPNATPQSNSWRSHLARRTLTLGAASLKARCYDAAMHRLPSKGTCGFV